MSTSNHPDEPMILTLENSVIKVKEASQPRMTDIEQWTTAFTVYMSVMTHQFPGSGPRAVKLQEFNMPCSPNSPVYWDTYDHKFRCKAALNPSLNWSLVDQQLWLMIFTTLPDILLQQYLLLSNGPHNWTSSGGAQGSFCRNFNTVLDVSVNHACTNTCATPMMANTLDPHVPLSIPSLPSTISEIQNVSTTFQNQNEIKEQPPISIPHLEAAFSGHPDQHFVSQLCSNFKFGVHIGF